MKQCTRFTLLRFRTDPDLGGTEKISVCEVKENILEKPYAALPSLTPESAQLRCSTDGHREISLLFLLAVILCYL